MKVKSLTGVLLAAILALSGCVGNVGTISEKKESPAVDDVQEETVVTEPESEPEQSAEVAGDETAEAEPEPEEEEEEEDEPEEEQGPPFSDSLEINTADGKSVAAFYALDTVISMTIYGPESENALKAAADLIDRLDRVISPQREGSELRILNENGNAICSDELIEAVSLGQEYGKATDGAFNIAIYPVVDAWGFFSGEYRVPEAEEIEELLTLARPEDVKEAERPSKEWSNGRRNSKLKKGIVFETEGMKIDLGGIGKGYIADKIALMFNEDYADGVTGAVISLGGNIICLGKKPEGKSFKVGLQDPGKAVGEYLAVVTAVTSSEGNLTPYSIVTSGNYERFFEVDGVKYTHIIDPETGYPVDNGLASVTVISENSALADAFTTALFVMGYDKAVEFWRSSTYDFEMALIDENGKLYLTEGLKDQVKSYVQTEIITR